MSDSTTATLAGSKVDPQSAAGFGTGKSEHYNKARPSYSPESLSSIRNAVSKKDGLKIVELGCGSGIFTRDLLAHPDWSSSIAEMRCIDPNEGMRAVFTQTVSDPRVTLSEGTFDSTGVPDGWADVIVAASAFHWCSNLEETAIELARISAPGSTMVFLWTFPNKEVPWIAQSIAVAAPYLHGGANSIEKMNAWRQIFSLSGYQAHFLPPEEENTFMTLTGTRARVTAYMLSASGIAVQPKDVQEKIIAQIGEVLDRGEGLVWIDKEKGEFEQPFGTNVVVMRRKE